MQRWTLSEFFFSQLSYFFIYFLHVFMYFLCSFFRQVLSAIFFSVFLMGTVNLVLECQLNFRSKGKMLVVAAIVVRIRTIGPIWTIGPIRTIGPIQTFGPIQTTGPIWIICPIWSDFWSYFNFWFKF